MFGGPDMTSETGTMNFYGTLDLRRLNGQPLTNVAVKPAAPA